MSPPVETPAKQIGIAVVEYRGRYLVGVRPVGSELAGCSEFPGGKVHPGETPEACACRECLEETLLEVTAVELLLRRTFTYPHGTFDLHFWLCRPTSDGAVRDTHNGFRWVTNAELATLTFPGGNAPVVGLLTVNCTTS